ncbi:MAG: RES family NAD+ phosphorylase [Dehalococcoidia bacterium]
MPDPEDIYEAIDALGVVSFQGHCYRHIAVGRSPTSGLGAREAGGRWNPRDSFPVLYTGLSTATVRAELARLAKRMNVELTDLLPRRVYTLEASLSAVVDLRSRASLTAVGLSIADVQADDLTGCQGVGAAAHKLGREGILAPSATGIDDVLAIFELNLRPASSLQVESFVEWP